MCKSKSFVRFQRSFGFVCFIEDIHHYPIYFWIIFRILVRRLLKFFDWRQTWKSFGINLAWAFIASEWIIIIMGLAFILILIFHKYSYVHLIINTEKQCETSFISFRSIILRRFFALGGTIFFLRSITMLVTSLSVSNWESSFDIFLFDQNETFDVIEDELAEGSFSRHYSSHNEQIEEK